MAHHTEDSPLSMPRPQARRLNGLLLVLAGAAGASMLLLLLYSVMTPVPTQDTRSKEQAASQAQEGKPLTDTPEVTGLATLPSAKTDKAVTDPTPPAVPNRQPSPAMLARLQEQDQLRRMKTQLQLQALQSPLSTGAGGTRNTDKAETRQVSSPAAQGSVQRRTVDAITPEASEVNDKELFLDRVAQGDDWRLQHSRTAGAHCEIKTGTVIPGIMLTGINSDLPGQIIGQVSQNVYDTATGNMLVIPQGARLFGVYDSRVAVGQSRVLIAWNRIVFPDGSSITLESMPGSDQAGYSGFNDTVDNHYLRIFGSAAIMSLITGGMAYAVDSTNNSGNSDTDSSPTMQDEMGTALASQLGQASLQLLQQNVTIKPTLGIRPGFRFNIVLVKDMAFDSSYVPMPRRR